MAENDFVVNFGTDDFQVVFGEQGPQGPSAAATPFDINDTYEQGNIVFDTSGNLFGSRVNNNTGNQLTDTDVWVALGIAAGAVTQLDDLTDVTITSPILNEGLFFNGTSWVNRTVPNNIPINPTQEKLSLSVDPDTIKLGTGTTQVSCNLSINAGFGIQLASFVVKDQNNHVLPATVTNLTVNFFVDNSIRGHVSIEATAQYVRDSDSEAGTDTITRNVLIEESYYSIASTTQPTSVESMTDEGVWSSPKELTQTTDNTGRNYYVALPTDRAPYEFTSGIAIFNATNLGVISTDYTLFQLTDFNDDPAGRSFIVDIAEA